MENLQSIPQITPQTTPQTEPETDLKTALNSINDRFTLFFVLSSLGLPLFYLVGVLTIAKHIYELPLVYNWFTWSIYCLPFYTIALLLFIALYRYGYTALTNQYNSATYNKLYQIITYNQAAQIQSQAETTTTPETPAEQPISLTQAFNAGNLEVNGNPVSSNHYNTSLTFKKCAWLVPGQNNEKLALPSDLKANGYTINTNTDIP